MDPRRVFEVAVRLLRGEAIGFADEHGRRWLATADRLDLELGGELGPVLEGVTASDVASEVVTLEVTTSPGLPGRECVRNVRRLASTRSRIPSRFSPPQPASDSVDFGAPACAGEPPGRYTTR